MKLFDISLKNVNIFTSKNLSNNFFSCKNIKILRELLGWLERANTIMVYISVILIRYSHFIKTKNVFQILAYIMTQIVFTDTSSLIKVPFSHWRKISCTIICVITLCYKSYYLRLNQSLHCTNWKVFRFLSESQNCER